MPLYKIRALVLNKTKLGETDLIITMMDEEGIQRRGVAKGARKPGSFLAARLELYMLVEAQLSKGRSLDIVTDVRVLESNVACRIDIEHSAASAVPMELIQRATAHHNAEPLLFKMSLAALEAIGSAEGTAPYLLSLTCVLKLCAALGVRPHAHELPDVDDSLAAWVDKLLQARFIELVDLTGSEYLPLLRDLADFCERWLTEHLDLKLKSLSFLKGLLV